MALKNLQKAYVSEVALCDEEINLNDIIIIIIVTGPLEGHAWVRRPRCGATTQSRHRHNIYYCMSGSPDTNTSSAADIATALSKIVSDNIESGDVLDRT